MILFSSEIFMVLLLWLRHLLVTLLTAIVFKPLYLVPTRSLSLHLWPHTYTKMKVEYPPHQDDNIFYRPYVIRSRGTHELYMLVGRGGVHDKVFYRAYKK